MAIPIVITTYERTLYLTRTIACLEDSDADLSNLIIYDDGSHSECKKKLLTSLAEKYIVIRRTKSDGPFLSMREAIDIAFGTFYDSDTVFYLQDDIECNIFFAKKGLEIYSEAKKKHNVGILSLYNRRGPDGDLYYQMKNGHPGGVAWIIDKTFWERYILEVDIETANLIIRKGTDAKIKHGKRNLGDYKICKAALSLGFDICVVCKSLVQHVGDKSTLTDRDMTYCRAPNYVGKHYA